MDKHRLREKLEAHLYAEYGKGIPTASEHEYWTSLSRVVMEMIGPDWERSRALYAEGRQVHYFSAEFLVGRSLLNNLLNREWLDEVRARVEEDGFDFDAVLNEETDPALGNGGLGRLAACFLDSSATMDLPVMGHWSFVPLRLVSPGDRARPPKKNTLTPGWNSLIPSW